MGSGIYCFGGNCSKDPREDSSSVFAGGTAALLGVASRGRNATSWRHLKVFGIHRRAK